MDGQTGGQVGGWMNQSILTIFIPSGACNIGQECSKFRALTLSVRSMARLLGGSMLLHETDDTDTSGHLMMWDSGLHENSHTSLSPYVPRPGG